MTPNYGCITTAILLIGCALTCAGDDLVIATIGGAAYTGQLRAEVRVTPDRLVGKPGAKPLNPNWAASSERASMGISLMENAIGTISFPFPVAGRASINLPGIAETTYTVCPMHVEKEYTFANGLKGKSYWFVSVNEPYAYAYFELTNPTDKPITQTIEESADLLVGQGDLPTEAKSLGDDGSLCRWTAPRLDIHYAAVRSSLPGVPQVIGAAINERYNGVTGDPIGGPGLQMSCATGLMIVQNTYGIGPDFKTITVLPGCAGRRLVWGKLEVFYPDERTVEVRSGFNRDMRVVFPGAGKKASLSVSCKTEDAIPEGVKTDGKSVSFSAAAGKIYRVHRNSL